MRRTIHAKDNDLFPVNANSTVVTGDEQLMALFAHAMFPNLWDWCEILH